MTRKRQQEHRVDSPLMAQRRRLLIVRRNKERQKQLHLKRGVPVITERLLVLVIAGVDLELCFHGHWSAEVHRQENLFIFKEKCS